MSEASTGPGVGQGSLATVKPSRIKTAAVATGTETVWYTSPTGKAVEVTQATVCNTTAGALTLSISVLPKTAAAGIIDVADANRKYKALSVAANATVSLAALLSILADGDKITALGSGAGLTLDLSGKVYG